MIPGWRKQYLRYRTFLLNVIGHYKRRKDLKVYLEIFLSLATISAFSILALRPTLVTIGELIKEIEAKEETLLVMEGKINNLRQAQIIYDQERSRINTLSFAIPTSPEPDNLALQFEGISSKYQTPLDRLSLGASVVKGVSSENAKIQEQTTGEFIIPYVFTTQSNYQNLVQVVSDLQNLRRLLKINSLTLSIDDSGERSGEIILNVNGNAVYMPKNK